MSYDVLAGIRETLLDPTATIGELRSALSHAEASLERLTPPTHGGASDTLDDLRSLIVRDDSGLTPEDITMLGRVEGWLHHLELQAVAEKAKVARYGAKITRWMPIVAASQESDELPEGWTWREAWKFSAEGPDGVVCEPKWDYWPWCTDAPKAVMQVVGKRACTVQTSIQANQIAKPLADRCRIRDTREGMWPEDGERVHFWDGDEWWSWQYGCQHDGVWDNDRLWLPAPPPPEEP